MKLKYIIGIAAGIIFVALAVFSFDSTKAEEKSFPEAKESGKVVRVLGSWDKSGHHEYDTENNTFIFTMADQEGNTTKVICNGSKPNNFDVAPMLVVKGQFKGEDFHASELLTKCPSKYEGEFEELKGTQLYN
jgi:cytochrome c-type biogenesis protein CcmE